MLTSIFKFGSFPNMLKCLVRVPFGDFRLNEEISCRASRGRWVIRKLRLKQIKRGEKTIYMIIRKEFPSNLRAPGSGRSRPVWGSVGSPRATASKAYTTLCAMNSGTAPNADKAGRLSAAERANCPCHADHTWHLIATSDSKALSECKPLRRLTTHADVSDNSHSDFS